MLRLQEERESQGWNRSELARKARIDLAGLSRLERGLRVPYEPEKQRLAEVLGVPAEELFKEVEEDGDR